MLKILILKKSDCFNNFRLCILKNILSYQDIKVDVFSTINYWGDTNYKINMIKKPYKLLIKIIKNIKKNIKEINKLKERIEHNDIIIIEYPAYIDFLIIRLFSKKNSFKTIIDFFLSPYDTVVLDRKIVNKNALKAKLLFIIDKWLLNKSNKVMVDTNVNIDRYRSIFDSEKKDIYRVFVGSYLLLTPLKKEINLKINNNKMNIGWVGSIIPLHGIEKILAVASLLKEKDFFFHIIGDDPDNEWAERNSQKHHNQYIKFYGRLNFHDSMEILSECDICLGIFGDSDKAKSVIPFKIFDYMVLRKVIVTQNSRAIQELGEISGLFMVDNTINALVNQLMWIKKNIKNIQIKYPDIRRLMENDLRKLGILNNEKH